MSLSVQHVLWSAQSILACKKFISNFDRILQNDFHLKSSFDKTKYIFD